MYNWKKRLLAAVLAGCMTVGLMAPALATVGGEDTASTAVDPGFSVDPVYPVEPTDPVEPVEPTPPVETEIPDGEIPLDPGFNVPDYANMSTEELYEVVKDLSDEDRAIIYSFLTEEQIAALEEYEKAMELPTEFDVEAAYEYVMSLTDVEAIDAYLMTLTEEQLEALRAYIMEKELENYTPPETVVVTDAGPFLPPVDVGLIEDRDYLSSENMMSKMAQMFAPSGAPTEPEPTDNGLELSKNAVKNEDGSYTITLDAYTTGTVKTETSTAPVDIVLVLDQSGSMAYDFNGDSTGTNSERRQYAMKASVNKFIDSVAQNYNAEKSDHRMAIVTFGSGSDVLMGWTYADLEGAGKLQGAITGLPNQPSGATNVGAGMQEAETLMDTGYNYDGDNTTRQKVVVVFTDGVPTTGTAFDIGVANTAIQSAKNLKDQKVTIYSIGIFTGANPNKLHGDVYHYFDWGTQTTSCTGEIGSVWNSNITTIFGDISDQDIPAGNRFLNFLSTNFENATEIGIVNKNDTILGLGIGYYGYQITKNFDRTAPVEDNYYLTASDSESLNKIFEEISNSVGTPTINLDSTTVIQDVVSDYFEIPSGAQVALYTAPCVDGDKTNGFTFGERTPYEGNVDINGDTVKVTGFDFNKNYVAKDETTGDHRGSKLIIEFTVQAKEGFWGGNGVPTNGDTSGVYTGEGTSVEMFEVPTVDVPVQVPAMAGTTVNIYGGSSINAEDLLNPGSIPDDWRTDYVTVSCTADKNVSNLVSGNYNITVTATAETDPSNSDSESATGAVNVFMPTLTFKDSKLKEGETPNYETENRVPGEVWMCDDVQADPETMGPAPELELAYDPASVNVAGDHAIEVTVQNKTTGVVLTDYVTFVRQACAECSYGGDTHKGAEKKCEFVVHIFVPEFTFTLTKELTAAADGEQTFVFHIEGTGVDMTVALTIPNGGTSASKQITLPSGTYTVTEDTDWSWKYDMTSSSGTTVSQQNDEAIFTNTRNDKNWLGGSNSVENDFAPVNSGSSDQTIDTLDALVPPLPTGEKKQENEDDQKKTEPDPGEDPDLDGMTQEGGVDHV